MEITIGAFDEAEAAIRAIRTAVFIDEQQVPLTEEFDEADRRCTHVVARIAGEPVGTGRLDVDGRVGRIAVLAPHRRTGVGRAVMAALEEVAIVRGHSRLHLGAQESAVPFYRDLGYDVCSAERWMEAGIPHVRMEKRVDTDSAAE